MKNMLKFENPYAESLLKVNLNDEKFEEISSTILSHEGNEVSRIQKKINVNEINQNDSISKIVSEYSFEIYEKHNENFYTNTNDYVKCILSDCGYYVMDTPGQVLVRNDSYIGFIVLESSISNVSFSLNGDIVNKPLNQKDFYLTDTGKNIQFTNIKGSFKVFYWICDFFKDQIQTQENSEIGVMAVSDAIDFLSAGIQELPENSQTDEPKIVQNEEPQVIVKEYEEEDELEWFKI